MRKKLASRFKTAHCVVTFVTFCHLNTKHSDYLLKLYYGLQPINKVFGITLKVHLYTGASSTQVIYKFYTGFEQVVLGKQTPGNTFHFLPTSTFNTLTTQDTGYTFHCKSPNTSSLTYCTCPRSVSLSCTTPSLPRLGGSGSAELNFSTFSQVADARNTLLLLVLNTNTNRRVTHSY